MKSVRLGCGAGFADDRIEPAARLAEEGAVDYLVFECLAERTIALSSLERANDPERGYNEWLEDRLEAVLPACLRNGVTIITNMGAANPASAARVVAEVARRHGAIDLRIAVVEGDDVLRFVAEQDLPLLEIDGSSSSLVPTMVSANAYLGAGPIVEALRLGADVVVTGRVSDPSLYVAPLIHEFGWDPLDWDLMGKAVSVGHLLECGAQVTGGYFADPGHKEVPGIEDLGFPIAVVSEDGSFVVTKAEGTGGRVDVATCTEQILYEVHDPSYYVSPDVCADFSGITFEQVGVDSVLVRGATGRERPEDLKVSIGYRDGFMGEGQISYAGPNAAARGELALEILRRRFAAIGLDAEEVRFELIGLNAVHRGAGVAHAAIPDEVRVRAAARTRTIRDAHRVGHEVHSLWLNGPYGGGGAFRSAVEILAIASVFVPRASVRTTVTMIGTEQR